MHCVKFASTADLFKKKKIGGLNFRSPLLWPRPPLSEHGILAVVFCDSACACARRGGRVLRHSDEGAQALPALMSAAHVALQPVEHRGGACSGMGPRRIAGHSGAVHPGKYSNGRTPYEEGAAPPPCTPPPDQSDHSEIYNWENLVGPFWVPDPPPVTETCSVLAKGGKHTSAQEKPRQWYIGTFRLCSDEEPVDARTENTVCQAVSG